VNAVQQYGHLLSKRVSSRVSHCPPLYLCLSPCTALAMVTLYRKIMGWKVRFHSLLRPIHNANDHSPSPRRQGFTRGNTKSNQNLKGQYNGSQSPIQQNAPPMPPLVNSPSMSSTYSQEAVYNEHEPKRFLNEKYAKCSVKGNFLTLAAQPKNVDLGEWLAHQCMF